MNKALLLLSVWLLASSVVADQGTPHQEKAPLTNTYCPVQPEEEVDPDYSVEYEGKRVYFCCRKCRTKFLANPEAYLANLPQFAAASARVGVEGTEREHAEAAAHGKEGGHDHATGHGQPEGLAKPLKFIGKFHPLVVHFPIALILVALLAEGLSLWRGGLLFPGAARFALTLGAAGAVVAASLGWLAAKGAHYPGDLVRVLFLHRWAGVSVAVLSLSAAALSYLQERGPRYLLAYRVALVLSAGLVGAAGHFGATLIYGTDYFTW